MIPTCNFDAVLVNLVDVGDGACYSVCVKFFVHKGSGMKMGLDHR